MPQGNPFDQFDQPTANGPVAIPLPMTPQERSAEARANTATAISAANLDLARQREARQSELDDRTIANSNFDDQAKLRSEFRGLPEVKNYETVIRQYSSALSNEPTPTGDQALITAYAKMLDPGSVVREQEFNTVAAADSGVGQMVARIKKELGIEGSGLLRPEIRQRVHNEMRNLVGSYAASYDRARQDYSDLAQTNGFAPNAVVGRDLAEPYQEKIDKFWKQKDADLNPLDQQRLASGGDDEQSIPIPVEMQAEHKRYIDANWGRIDPEGYAQFRSQLDQKYGFTPRPDQYRSIVPALNNRAAAGGGTEDLVIPSVNAPLEGAEALKSSMFNSPAGAFVMGAGSLGGGADEVAGGIRSVLSGNELSTEIGQANALRQAAAEERPWWTLAGNLAGAAATGFGAGAALPNAGRLGTYLLGTGYGATSGALESNGNRLLGGAIGTVAGAGGAYLGEKVAAPIAERLTRRFSNVPSGSVADDAIADFAGPIDNVRSQLQSAQDLNIPMSLADTDPRLRSLAGAVSRRSVNARDLAERTFETRARGQAERALEQIDGLAPRTDIPTRQAELYQAGNIESEPFYREASQRAGIVDPEVENMLQTSTGKDALSRAYKIAENEGRDPMKLGFDLNEQGEVVLREAPSFETLDLVKRGIDSRIYGEANPLTGKVDFKGNPELKSLENFRKRYVAALDRVNPVYQEARAAYAPYAKRAETLQIGARGPSNQVRPNDLKRITGDMDPANLDEYRRGYASRLGEMAEDTRLSGNPYERIYGSTAQQEKIGQLFPNAARFGQAYEMERAMGKTAHETLGGSPTAQRLQADEQLGSTLGAGLALGGDVVAGGGAMTAGMVGGAIRRAFADKARLGVGKAAERKAEQIAPALFNTDPAASLAAIDQYAARQAAINARRQNAQRYGGLFGSLVLPTFAPSGS